MRTRITELFGIECPTIQGVMHYVGFAELAADVSNEYLPQLKAAAVNVIHKCTSVRHSLKAESIGKSVIATTQERPLFSFLLS